MPNPNRIKEELSNLRLFFTAFFAVDASVIAWLAEKFPHVHDLIVIAGIATSSILTIYLVIAFLRMNRLVAQLEKIVWSGQL